MKIFGWLRSARDFERRRLHRLQTLEDFDIVMELGFHQSRRRKLTLTGLLAMGLGSPATVRRRLERLKRARVVLAAESPDDGRAVLLALSPAALRTYRGYERLLLRIAAERSTNAR